MRRAGPVHGPCAVHGGGRLTAARGLTGPRPPCQVPVWVQRERDAEAAAAPGGSGGELPFGLYLLFSSIVLIAAVRPAAGGGRAAGPGG